ncbi:unnamed protein product [Caretta caretta]
MLYNGLQRHVKTSPHQPCKNRGKICGLKLLLTLRKVNLQLQQQHWQIKKKPMHLLTSSIDFLTTEIDNNVADWIENYANDLVHQLLDDAEIRQTVLHANSNDEAQDSAKEELTGKHSHRDAATAGNLFLQYLEQQPDTDPLNCC